MTMGRGSLRTAGAAVAMLAGVMALHGTAAAQATVASDRPAGLVIWPKIVVDTIDAFNQGRTVDTTIQFTNTSSSIRTIQCFIVDTTSRCNNGTNRFSTSEACREGQVPSDCLPGGACLPEWSETDFPVTLSPRQPFGWTASEGGTVPPAGGAPGGSINPTDTVFTGEVKCVEVNSQAAALPINANDIKGEANIYEVSTVNTGSVDVRSYNAIGVQTVLNDGSTQNDQVLCLGATSGSAECATAEYASCPAVLILNHFFDQSVPGFERRTDLTLIPCSQNFAENDLTEQVVNAVQFLVYNEFEQRFSASTRFQCFRETQLSLIDSRPGQERFSIWNVGVQGTLTGQTRIRSIVGPENDVGHGVLAVAEQFREFVAVANGDEIGSAAFNLNYVGLNPGRGDFVRYSVSTGP